MKSVKFALAVVGVSLILGALVLGLVPITVGDTNRFGGDGYSCGSAFIVNGKLTDSGHEYCEIFGGAANRRIQAFALLLVGMTLTLSGLVTEKKEEKGPPTSEFQSFLG